MKKSLIILLIVCFVLGGCGKEEPAKQDNDPKKGIQNKYLDTETYNLLFNACYVATTDTRIVEAVKGVGKTHIYINSDGVSYEHDIAALKESINNVVSGIGSVNTSQEYSILIEYKADSGVVVTREKYPENL